MMSKASTGRSTGATGGGIGTATSGTGRLKAGGVTPRDSATAMPSSFSNPWKVATSDSHSSLSLKKSAVGNVPKKSAVAPAAEPKFVPSTKISARCVPKPVQTLGMGTHKTAFSSVYSKGGIPFRLMHGSVKHKIAWSTPPAALSYNPLFITVLEGLRETEHPHAFVVPEGLKNMIQSPGAKEKIIPIMTAAVVPLRMALGSKDKPVLVAALNTLPHLAKTLGAQLLLHLAHLLPPIAAHAHSRDPVIRDCVTAALQGIESGIAGIDTNGDSFGTPPTESTNRTVYVTSAGGKGKMAAQLGEWIGVGGGDRGVGGPDGAEALRLIKAKVPTYTSVFG